MTRVSRRGLLGKLLGDRPSAPAPEVESDGLVPEVSEQSAPATDLEAPSPAWLARERARTVMASTPQVARITSFTCIAASGCSVCSERCPEPGAIVLTHGRPRVEEALCTGCGACAEACPAPTLAISLLPRLPPPRGST